MDIKEVKLMIPEDRFFYWMRERHNIFLKRKGGRPKPWTDDEVLRSFFFTNPYRENDKVTIWFRENIRNPLRDSPEVIFATVAFRWFNYIPTGTLLWEYGNDQDGVANLLEVWNKKIVLRLLGKVRDEGGQIFTGAFMINSPGGIPKLEAICDRISNVWDDRKDLIEAIRNVGTLEGAHKVLTCFPGLGGFMAYEIVCDLRYTRWLEKATDKDTWCNPGPGAIRGLYRISGEEFTKGNNATSPPKPKDWQERMIKLLNKARSRLQGMPHLEMREIEHSLCEFDKYDRALFGDGRMKRTYNG